MQLGLADPKYGLRLDDGPSGKYPILNRVLALMFSRFGGNVLMT